MEALTSGRCTHADIRNVLRDALDPARHPILDEAVRQCLAGSFCHLVVDEAFDMNPLDIAVVERAIEAGLPLTMVGDPWQSLYEFRGSTPKQVARLINSHPFRRIDMPGEHRYENAEMIELARALFSNDPFAVRAAKEGDTFDIVLAHDWGTLWNEDRIPMVPGGKPKRLDRRLISLCFMLLLNAFIKDRYGIEASGVGEARRAFPYEDISERLGPALDALQDPSRTCDEIWDLLRTAFQPSGRRWPAPGAIARRCLERLAQAARMDATPLLGLSVHQAKGLEWDSVLFLNGELSTLPGELNRLDIDEVSHRNIYVALTRARSMVRIAHVSQDPYGIHRSPVERIHLRMA